MTSPRPTSLPGAASTTPPGASLSTQAHAWLGGVPPRYQPLATARRFPHIVNRLAALWASSTELRAYLDELLSPSRPGRHGFPFDVLTELSDLQAYVAGKP